MKCFPFIICLLGLSCHSIATAEGVGIVTIRQPGASLDTSVRHEVDNAKRLAAEWLIARQQPDGSWGSTNANTVLTPIVWLALKGMDDAVDAVARDRAVVWLDNQPISTNAPLVVYAWRLLVTAFALPDTPERQSRIQALARAAQPSLVAHKQWKGIFFQKTPKNTAFWVGPRFSSAGLAWREANRLISGSPDPIFDDRAEEAIEWLARGYPTYVLDNMLTPEPEFFWCFARAINIHRKGVLIRKEEALDWRNDLGLALVNTQRKDLVGGGYWNGETDDAKIYATAFALLALREID